MAEGPIERGVAVVAALAPAEPSVADVVDALESVVDGPDEIRAVLARAEAEGVIAREPSRIRLGRPTAPTERRGRVVRREGEYRCRRCGRGVTTGHFLRVGSAEVGPYGSTCIRRLTGRD